MWILIGAGGLFLLLIIIFFVIYNRLVSAKNVVHEAFSGIDVQLKKRFELIPNLIEAVKGYNSHEADVLMKIAAYRGGVNPNVSEAASHDSSITAALKSFRITVEDYPELKANVQFLDLMKELSEVEKELSMARRYYNGTVRDLNTKVEVFPNVMIAGMTGFKKAEFYELSSEAERQAPEVNLSEE